MDKFIPDNFSNLIIAFEKIADKYKNVFIKWDSEEQVKEYFAVASWSKITWRWNDLNLSNNLFELNIVLPKLTYEHYQNYIIPIDINKSQSQWTTHFAEIASAQRHATYGTGKSRTFAKWPAP